MSTHNFTAVFLLGGMLVANSAAAAMLPANGDGDYLVHVWQTDNGLPQNWVSSIAQTPEGYLWIGMRYGGLARFDGVRFVPFNQQNTRELKDIQVEHLDVDETGRLWVIMGNESITAFSNGKFELFRHPRAQPRLRANRILGVRTNQARFAGDFSYLVNLDISAGTNGWQLLDPRPAIEPDAATCLKDGDDTIWFITQRRRLARFVDDRFEFLPQASGLPEPAVAALAVDSTKQLWAATSRHLVTWNGHQLVERTPTNGVAPEGIVRIAFSGDGGLWVLEKNRLRKCLKGQWVSEVNATEFQPGSLHGDAQGNVWLVAYGRGLWHIKSDGTVRRLTERAGLPSVFINCWFQDVEGDVWIGTHDGGIARIRERLFHALGQADGLPGKMVSSVCLNPASPDEELWAGTMSGQLARWQNGSFVNVPIPAPENNPNESITVCPDAEGGIWIGSRNDGLSLLRDGKLTRPPTPWGTVRVLFNDSQKRLWVGGLVNLFCLTNGGFKAFGSDDGFVDLHSIEAVAEDADGVIWIGTGPGDLWKYQAGQFSRFTPPSEWPSVRFAALSPDTNGVVWIGTLGGGLLRFCEGKFTHCLKEDGLPDNNVAQLLDSQDGHLWGGTYAGIFRVRKSELEAVANGTQTHLQCRTYGQFDGLPALECSSGFQPNCWRSRDGRLWFSTANGVTTVDPTRTVPNPIAPTVIIEEMLVDSLPVNVPPRVGVPLTDVSSALPIRIPPGRHYVQFRYTGLNFSAPDGVRFRVKLEGGEGQWQSTEDQRIIGYGPLMPGEYRFRVTACNNDGLWNETGDTLAFIVMPYFWETWWFRAGLVLLTLVILGIVVALVQRQRYRRRLEQVERQRELAQERTRIARDLHDDLGTSLTQISLLSALANRDQTPAPEAKELIQEVRGRARDMVIALDEIVWAVNPKNDSLAGLVNYLGHFAEEFFRASDIRFRLDLPAHVPEISLSAESRHDLFLAFKEAVNNVARHSHATEAQVCVAFTAQEISISVADNGRGFGVASNAQTPTGDGLANMKRRLEQLGGQAELQSKPGVGTTVTFHAPLRKH
jgi:signal transduction histidine kinase/ligand-binding sensor domain-containing protein